MWIKIIDENDEILENVNVDELNSIEKNALQDKQLEDYGERELISTTILTEKGVTLKQFLDGKDEELLTTSMIIKIK